MEISLCGATTERCIFVLEELYSMEIKNVFGKLVEGDKVLEELYSMEMKRTSMLTSRQSQF